MSLSGRLLGGFGESVRGQGDREERPGTPKIIMAQRLSEKMPVTC